MVGDDVRRLEGAARPCQTNAADTDPGRGTQRPCARRADLGRPTNDRLVFARVSDFLGIRPTPQTSFVVFAPFTSPFPRTRHRPGAHVRPSSRTSAGHLVRQKRDCAYPLALLAANAGAVVDRRGRVGRLSVPPCRQMLRSKSVGAGPGAAEACGPPERRQRRLGRADPIVSS